MLVMRDYPDAVQGPRRPRARADAGVAARARPALPQRDRRADRAEGRLPDGDARLDQPLQGARELPLADRHGRERRLRHGRRRDPRLRRRRAPPRRRPVAGPLRPRSASSAPAPARPPRRASSTSPAYRASAIPASSSPSRGPGSMPELARQLVAAHQRRRRARGVPGERVVEHRQRDLQVRARSPRSALRPRVASRSAIDSSVTSAATGSQATR